MGPPVLGVPGACLAYGWRSQQPLDLRRSSGPSLAGRSSQPSGLGMSTGRVATGPGPAGPSTRPPRLPHRRKAPSGRRHPCQGTGPAELPMASTASRNLAPSSRGLGGGARTELGLWAPVPEASLASSSRAGDCLCPREPSSGPASHVGSGVRVPHACLAPGGPGRAGTRSLVTIQKREPGGT